MAVNAIVGSWRVSARIPGVEQEAVNLATFTSDVTVVAALATPSPPAPGQQHHIELFSTALGSWQAQADGSVLPTFVSLGADEHGTPAGSHTISAHVTVGTDHQT